MLLAIGIILLITNSLSHPSRLGLPVGKGSPAISLGERHGLILASDGSLWSWGSDFLGWPVLGLGNRPSQSTSLRRIGNETNWVSIAAGTAHNLAVKSDGSLWAWGRQAHVYTGASDQAQDATPTRVGTDSDWRTISASAGWWCQGLTKKDGSLWLMDASDGQSNGPQSPYQPVRFRRVALQKDYVVYAGGAVHAASPGVHGPIGVVLTRDGEVWTWGMVLGDPPTLKSRSLALLASIANFFHLKTSSPDPPPVFREQPWRLRNH